MKLRVALFAAIVSFAAPPTWAQIFSFDPLKDVENALPAGVPNEGKIIQARLQVREMAQDALPRSTRSIPARDESSKNRPVTGCSVRSA